MGVGPYVGVTAGVLVRVGVGEGLLPGVSVGVGVKVNVIVGVCVDVGMGVRVLVAVDVAVMRGVLVSESEVSCIIARSQPIIRKDMANCRQITKCSLVIFTHFLDSISFDKSSE